MIEPIAQRHAGTASAAASSRFLRGRGSALGQAPDPHAQLTQQARKWVAQTFYGTVLRQMRNSPFKSEVFSGGRGGEAFSMLLDQHLADRMAGAAGDRLVNSIVRQIEGRGRHQPDPSRQNGTGEPAKAGGHVATDRRA